MILRSYMNEHGTTVWEVDGDGVAWLTQALELLESAVPGAHIFTPLSEGDHVLLRAADE